MKPLPAVLLQLLETLPDAKAQKIVLHTDGKGQWEVEVYSRYRVHERTAIPPHLPLREKAVRHPRGDTKSI
jgi:hypothetical protein